MKNLLCHILICMAVFLGGAGVFPSVTIAAQEINRPVLIITDVSGSMKDCAYETEDQGQKKYINKVNVLKHLLLSTVRELNGKPCKLGIYRMRYLAGEKALYVPFIPIDSHENQEVIDRITDDFLTQYQVFNRRTPITDTLRQLDENELEAVQGRMSILIISDGNETFYDIDEEWDREEPETDDKVTGPLSGIRRLMKKYKDNLKLYTIYIKNQCNENEEDRTHGNFLMDIKTAEEAGEKDKYEKEEFLLAEMASAGGGKGFFGNAMIDNESLVKELAEMLCYEEKELAQVPPPQHEPPAEIVLPVIAAVSPSSSEPEDSDRDGVYDDNDRCPGTPRGAEVNETGCWILKGINFDTAKWNIKPEFYPVLNEVADVLRQNPGLMVEVQGHTDNRGTAVYNKRLSEKRAESVMKYFIKNGIEPERLSSSGYGLTIPIFPNDTPENRAGNRRVELKPLP